MSEEVPKFLIEMFKDKELVEQIIKDLERSDPDTLETSVYKTDRLNFWHKILDTL